MLKKKQYRHKPIYKKFVTLRVNAQYKRRLLLLKFNKQKWQRLILYLKRLQNRRKKNFQIFDLNKINLPKNYNSFRKKYKTTIQDKSKIKIFYGNVLNKTLKKNLNLLNTRKKKNLKNLINNHTFILKSFETKLDIILYRAHFVNSVRAARQLILHNHIKVNGNFISTSSYVVKVGDHITVNKKIFSLMYKNIYSSHLWPLPPKYLQINYKTLEILIISKIEYNNLSIFFPFFPKLYNILTFNKL